MQCTKFSGPIMVSWQQISVANTASCSKENPRMTRIRTQAAVCSAYAAKVYGLEDVRRQH